MFFQILLVSGALIILAVLFLRSCVVIPTVHYGVVLFLKKRTGRILKEGLHIVWPFFESVELFKHEVQTMDIVESFFSADNLEILVKGTVQFAPDEELVSSKFIEIGEKTITDGLSSAIKSELGVIAGTKPGDAFIRSREAIKDLINCVLRMQNPFHVQRGLPPDERLDFYILEGNNIRQHLSKENKLTSDKSELEQKYGIDVLSFELSDVDFSPATKKSLEMKKQTEEKLKADQLEANKLEELTKRLKDLGLDPQASVNVAGALMDLFEKKIFSLEGLGGLEKAFATLPVAAKAPSIKCVSPKSCQCGRCGKHHVPKVPKVPKKKGK